MHGFAKTALPVLGCLLLTALTAGILVLSLDAHDLMVDADIAMRHVDSQVSVTGGNLNKSFEDLHSIMAQASIAADQARMAAIEQRAYWAKTSADSDKTVMALRLTIDRAGMLLSHADAQLDGQIFPATLKGLQSFNRSADDLDVILRDPHINGLALHLEDTSASLAKSAASGAHLAKFYDEKLTKPASLAKTVALGFLDIASKLGSVFAGFVK